MITPRWARDFARSVGDARFVPQALVFQMQWHHKGPFPRRTREQRREDYMRCCHVTAFEVERYEALIRAGHDVEPDRSWRPTA